MIRAEPIGWFNTGMPLLALAAMAVALPWLTVPRGTRSHRRLAWGIAAAAGLVLLAGVAIFAAAYAARGADIAAALRAMPMATSLVFLRLSGLSALVWGPLLLLMWLAQAQALEKRRGEDAARRDRGGDR